MFLCDICTPSLGKATCLYFCSKPRVFYKVVIYGDLHHRIQNAYNILQVYNVTIALI